MYGEYSTSKGVPVLLFRRVNAKPLSEHVDKLDEGKKETLRVHALAALHRIHEQGVCHNDLCVLDNLLFDSENGHVTVWWICNVLYFLKIRRKEWECNIIDS